MKYLVVSLLTLGLAGCWSSYKTGYECIDCGWNVSGQALICPQCGKPDPAVANAATRAAAAKAAAKQAAAEQAAAEQAAAEQAAAEKAAAEKAAAEKAAAQKLATRKAATKQAAAAKFDTSIKDALAKGDWQTVLRLDPDNTKALGLKASADKAVAEKAAAEKAVAEKAAAEKAAAEKAVAEKAAAEILASAPITNTLGMKLKELPAGTFLMGSPSDETGRVVAEHQHQVTISKAFYMQTTEVTQAQWKAVMGTEPWKGKVYRKEANSPATYVSWNDAVAYCTKLSAKEGQTYRLPTEAEWEYACRAGTKTTWSFGNDEKALGDYAWYKGNASNARNRYAYQIRQKKPNAFGLYDMHGNVGEWCHDYHGENYYKQSPEKDPAGPASGSFRVLRGGTWDVNSRYTRSACRSSNVPDNRQSCLYVGFRLVRELD